MSCGVLALGGIGDESYHRNSSPQALSFKYVEEAISKAINKQRGVFAEANQVCVADLGCGSGSNTICQVEYVVNEVLKVSSAPIQVHFSDLPEIDYNTLFTLLNAPQGQPYYYSGVPGTFYSKLFPDSSIHFAMCNIALQWLSKVPEEVEVKDSPAWNSGRIWISKFSTSATIQAFLQLAHQDLSTFLERRAEELVRGGILSLTMIGRPTEEQHEAWDLNFQAAWEDMIDKGILTQESLDSYNMAIYCRSMSEAENTLAQFADSFRILYKTQFKLPVPDPAAKGYKQRYAMHIKTLTWKGVVQHLGDEKKAELLYQKMMSIIETGAYPGTDHNVLAFVLERV